VKALVFHEPGRIAVQDVPDPSPGPGEVLLRVGAAAICYSDIRVYHGQKHAARGVIPGHEIAGTVAEVGDGVTRVRPGDRVAVVPIVACGHCEFCLSGRRHRCPQRRTLGYDDNGGLAQCVLIPERIVSLGHLLPLPDALSMDRACLTEPTACVLNSLETCGVAVGTSLALIGAGPMGLCHIVLARALGAGTIVVSEPDESRAQAARRFGADHVVDPTRDDFVAATKDLTAGRGADAVVVTAGLPDVLDSALAAVRRQGIVSLFAGFPPDTSVPFDPNTVHYSEVRLTGSQNASPEQYRRMTQLLPRLDDVDALTTHRFPLEDAAQAYEVRLRNEGLKSMVLVDAR
jgi:L-iditol 2-dehydrogenase